MERFNSKKPKTYRKSYEVRSPLFSLIVTTFNNERTIGRCLETMEHQTYKKIEIILVDEYSTDKTIEIAKKYEAKIYSGGPERSIKRNLGIEKAKGKYVFIFDSDQELDNNLVEDCISKIKGYDFLAVPELPFGPDFWAKCHRFEKLAYLKGYASVEAARFFSKSLILEFGGYDPEMVGSEDWDLTQRLIEKGYKMGHCRAMLHHNDGKYNLVKILKKKFTYGRVFRKYAKRHPKSFVTALVRPSFFALFFKNPVLFFGSSIMRFMEGSAVLVGMVFSK
jgi:glycosyltransferase involved in cell wall biosynthesis